MPTLEQIVQTKQKRLHRLRVMEIVLSKHDFIYPVDLTFKEQVRYLRRGIYHYQRDVDNYAGQYRE